MTTSAFAVMRAEVFGRPTAFAQDPHFQTSAYRRWLAARGPERKGDQWAWPAWRDADLAKTGGLAKRRPDPKGHAQISLGPLSNARLPPGRMKKPQAKEAA